MKLLSIAVPCYNSEAYMENCIRSLLVGGDDVEILIVDDGSRDRTAEIADRLEAEHPGIIRAIHQPNKGHGGAVNTGIENATGMYFKVVDSDDKVRAGAYKSILDVLRRFSGGEPALDLLISNFVYNKEDQNRHNVMQYRHCLPVGRVFSWEEANRFPVGKYILMHSVIYRTEVLRESGLQLPKHTFYVDNIYVTAPLPYVRNLYYLNADLYHYYIGREDQSVNETVMKSRIDQQLRVNKIMVDDLARENPENPSVWRYMRNYLDIITNVSGLLCVLIGTEEAMQKKDELWEYIRNRDDKVYKSLYNGFIATAFRTAMRFPSPANVKIVKTVYGIARKIYGFN